MLRRHKLTIEFMLKYIDKSKSILDLGAENVLSNLLKENGFNIRNTYFDLEEFPGRVSVTNCDIVTGFEILEHLIDPGQVLKNLECTEAVFSVPLMRMFERTYWNDSDPFDQHYHEFTTKQFNKLLKHCNFKILYSEKWRSYSTPLGWLLSWQPKYYIVYCEKT